MFGIFVLKTIYCKKELQNIFLLGLENTPFTILKSIDFSFNSNLICSNTCNDKNAKQFHQSSIRLEREADFLPPKCDLLTEVGTIYIGRNCKVPRKDLADLIPLAGGQTVNQLRMANVILGHDYIEEFLENDKVVQISEKWLLDSLQQHCPLPFVDYLIQK